MSERWLQTAVSGSFKFKPEIDRLHDEFADHQVQVLEPTKGWLYVPSRGPGRLPEFRPLPDEIGMAETEIEKRFLDAVERSDFMYLHNIGGYIGEMMSIEMGWALGSHTPIFAKEPIRPHNVDNGNIETYAVLLSSIVVASPAEAAAITREGSFDDHLMSDLEFDTKIAVAATDPQSPMYYQARRLTFNEQGFHLGDFGQP